MKVMNRFLLFCFMTSFFYVYSAAANSLYLELMKSCLLNLIYADDITSNQAQREAGKDWPAKAHTMIGLAGLDNIQYCLEDVIRNNIPGDCIETGVWRGGAVIFMRAILKSYNITDKTVWVADSFEGLPLANPVQYPVDNYSNHGVRESNKMLAISQETVQSNFAKYGLLDNKVKFLKGWFKDTLPSAPIDKLCLLRLDGDFYESTMNALATLYPKLSVGGYIIIDDYVAMTQCAQAVNDYRKLYNITDTLEVAGWSARYWKKTK